MCCSPMVSLKRSGIRSLRSPRRFGVWKRETRTCSGNRCSSGISIVREFFLPGRHRSYTHGITPWHGTTPQLGAAYRMSTCLICRCLTFFFLKNHFHLHLCQYQNIQTCTFVDEWALQMMGRTLPTPSTNNTCYKESPQKVKCTAASNNSPTTL